VAQHEQCQQQGQRAGCAARYKTGGTQAKRRDREDGAQVEPVDQLARPQYDRSTGQRCQHVQGAEPAMGEAEGGAHVGIEQRDDQRLPRRRRQRGQRAKGKQPPVGNQF
jgi:hypothetical protein